MNFWCYEDSTFLVFSPPAYWPMEYLVCKSGRGYTNLKNLNDLSPNLGEKARENLNATWQQYHWRYVFPADAKIKARAWACHQLNVLGEPKQCQKVITNSNLKTTRKSFDVFRAKSTSLSKGNLLPLEPVEVSHAYALEEGNHQKGNVGAAKTIIRDEYSCEEYSEGKRL